MSSPSLSTASKSSFSQDYLKAPYAGPSLFRQLNEYDEAFEPQRRALSQYINAHNPRSVAILGAGFLTDIPWADLVSDCDNITLVDWLDGVCETGIARANISTQEQVVSCALCLKDKGRQYCSNYSIQGKKQSNDHGLCDNAKINFSPYPSCENFIRTDKPRILKADISAGASLTFAQHAESITQQHSDMQSYLSALIQYLQESQPPQPLPLKKHGFDLVTSSMVLSQFLDEPVNYLIQLLKQHFVFPDDQEAQSNIGDQLELIKKQLFTRQASAHLLELKRLCSTSEQARVYVCTEYFRSIPQSFRVNTADKEVFMVDCFQELIVLMQQHFHFSVQDSALSLSEAKLGDGVSYLQHFWLTPKR